MTASSDPDAPAVPRPRVRKTARRIALGLPVLLALLGVAAYIEREPLLRAAANLWIVSDDLAPADAAAVFGGGLEYRPFAAADYYRRGLVKKILISNIGSSRAELLGVLDSHVEHNRKVLLKLGVPDTAIETFGSKLANTYEEARALHEWAERTGARSIIVPTDIFATRRLKWTLLQAFGDSVIVHVAAIEPLEYQRDDWWKSERGLIAFQNEILKYAYYRLKH
jgi:uncharacterized SAM-binding protein YcdF (DUF218 family)